MTTSFAVKSLLTGDEPQSQLLSLGRNDRICSACLVTHSPAIIFGALPQ